MVNCAACGQFMSAKDTATCLCKTKFHKQCVRLNVTSAVPKGWLCPNCTNNLPRTDNTNTPVKALGSPGVQFVTPSVETNQHEWKLADLIAEMKSMRVEINSRFDKFETEMKSLREELNWCRQKTTQTCERLTELESRVKCVESYENTVEALQMTIKQLKNEVNQKEQDSLINDIEIIGIPEHNNENLMHVVSLMATKLGMSIEESDVVEVFRAGPRHTAAVSASGPVRRPRPIVLRVTRRSVKQRLMKAARERKTLSSTDLSHSQKPNPVYLNERLTKLNRNLLQKVRSERKLFNWKYVYVRNGAILARKSDNEREHRFRSEEDIADIFGSEKPNNKSS